uniref:Uncharacterized protein n=1 Tax=Cucumis melo TaxID=3656 RepID=A0A9I9E383_CUCME
PSHLQQPPPILNLSNENAQKDLALGDFNAVNIVTSGAMTEIDDCQDKFAQPPKDTSLLKNGK